jgi:hypothetical protein
LTNTEASLAQATTAALIPHPGADDLAACFDPLKRRLERHILGQRRHFRAGRLCFEVLDDELGPEWFLARPQQRLPHPPGAVGEVVGRVNPTDPLEQPLVLEPAGRALTGGALVIGGRRRAQGPKGALNNRVR